MTNAADYELDEDILRRLRFRLDLTPGVRFQLNAALVREYALKRRLARQMQDKPTPWDLEPASHVRHIAPER